MRLGYEVVVLLRQVIEKDGLIQRELLRTLLGGPNPIERDRVALQLPEIAECALRSARELRLAPPVLAEGKKFLTLVQKTAAGRAKASGAPGVLEHRMAARLEWLTDFGALTKKGRSKNGFEFLVTADAQLLAELLEPDAGASSWADDVALGYWRRSQSLRHLRNQLPPIGLDDALRRGYGIMQRTVGPTSIREVCLAAGVLSPGIDLTLDQIGSRLIGWASEVPGITVSGGRYTRKPELVHMTRDVLAKG
jgi:hypothetical protein